MNRIVSLFGARTVALEKKVCNTPSSTRGYSVALRNFILHRRRPCREQFQEGSQQMLRSRRDVHGLISVDSGRISPKLPQRIRDAVPLRLLTPKPEEPFDVMIVQLCEKAGDGIVRFKWRTKRIVKRDFLVSRGLPGEIVTIKFGVVRQKDYPRGELELFVNPTVDKFKSSPWEIPSPCPHFDVCGGCDFLNLRYGRQLVEKQRWVERILHHKSYDLNSIIGRIRPSEPQQRYEHRTEWFFSEIEGGLKLGPPGSNNLEGPPSKCLLARRSVTRLLTAVHDAFCQVRSEYSQEARNSKPATNALVLRPVRASPGYGYFGDYTVYEEKYGLGVFKSVVVLCTRPPQTRGTAIDGRATWAGSELLLNFVLATEVQDTESLLAPLVNEAVAAVGTKRLVGVVANIGRSKKDLMGGRREVLLLGRRYVCQEFKVQVGGAEHGFVLHLGAGSRVLTHTRQLPDVARTVVEMCDIHPTDTIWHCFCGGGEIALALGALAEQVVAIGTSAMEVSELKRNLAANSVKNTTAVLANLRSPFTLKQLSYHIAQSQQRRLLLGTGEEQDKARNYALTTFVPGENRRYQMQRLAAAPFTAPLTREDALANRELRTLLPAFVRDFKPAKATMPVPVRGGDGKPQLKSKEVPPEMESRLKTLYRRLALKYHPDKNPNDPEASDRFQALTRAYKALVGDEAGPQEGDEKATDPFRVAQHSSYRPKFKDRWRSGRFAKRRIGGTKIPGAESEDEGDSSQKRGFVHARDDGENDEDDYEDEDFAVKMEIDESYARGPDLEFESEGIEELPPKDVVLEDDPRGELQTDGSADPVPTLPPPDVIVVTQPKARKFGVGTPKHFQTWLRSTAVRTVVYISKDVGAFNMDLKAIKDLGYRLVRVQPFDPSPHNRSVLLVARLDLILPLAGAKDYGPGGQALIQDAVAGYIPGEDKQRVPMLGGGGYTAIPEDRRQ